MEQQALEGASEGAVDATTGDATEATDDHAVDQGMGCRSVVLVDGARRLHAA